MITLDLRVLRPQPGASSSNAVLVCGAASDAEQHELYLELCDSVRGSEQWIELSKSSCAGAARPLPLCVWQHPHTRQTNARAKPRLVLDWAHGLAQRTAASLRAAGEAAELAEAIDVAKYDSLVSLLYAEGDLPSAVP